MVARTPGIRKVVIPAAGLGTRFLPLTKVQPKEMLPVVDKPVIQYVVEEAVLSGIDDILIITGRNKRAIEDHFDRSVELENQFRGRTDHPHYSVLSALSDMPDIHYIRQREQRGLGDAILLAERHCDGEPFGVLLGDTICIPPPGHLPCTRQMVDAFITYQRPVIVVEPVDYHKIQDYGIIKGEEIDENIYRIDDIVEKPRPDQAPSRLGAIGRYILTPDIFAILREIAPGHGGEVQLTDALRLLDGPLGLVTSCRRFDIGDKLGWMMSNLLLTLESEEFGPAMRSFLTEHLGRQPP